MHTQNTTQISVHSLIHDGHTMCRLKKFVSNTLFVSSILILCFSLSLRLQLYGRLPVVFSTINKQSDKSPSNATMYKQATFRFVISFHFRRFRKIAKKDYYLCHAHMKQLAFHPTELYEI
jgi:hypothetical protein